MKKYLWLLVVVELVLLPLLIACKGTAIPGTPAQSSSGSSLVIRPNKGGQLSFAGTGTELDKVKVTIPPAAIRGQSPLTINVSLVTNPPPSNTIPVGSRDSLLTTVGPTVKIEPSSPPTFDKPIEVTIPFDPALLPPLFDPQRLSVVVATTDSAGKRSWELISNTTVDLEAPLITFQLTHLSEASALAQEGAADLVKSLIFQAAEKMGGKLYDESGQRIEGKIKDVSRGFKFMGFIDSVAIDPMLTLFTTPGKWDEDALSAAILKLIEGLVDVGFPEYGLAIKAGKIIIGGSIATVEGIQVTVKEMYEAGDIQQRDALIVGGSTARLLSLFEPFRKDAFLDRPQNESKGIKANEGVTLENIAEKIGDEATLKTRWDFWRNQYGQSAPDRQSRIDEAWPDMLNYWRGKRTIAKMDALKAELKEQARATARKLEERRVAYSGYQAPVVPGKVTYKLQGSPTVNHDTKPTGVAASATISATSAVYASPDQAVSRVTQTVSWDVPKEIELGHSYAISFKSTVAVGKADKITIYIPATGVEPWQRAREEETYPGIEDYPAFRVVTTFSYAGTKVGPGIFEYSSDDGKTWRTPFSAAEVWGKYEAREPGMRQVLLPIYAWDSHVQQYSPPSAARPLPLTTPPSESYLEFRLRSGFSVWPEKLYITITAEATGLPGGGGKSLGTVVYTYQRQ